MIRSVTAVTTGGTVLEPGVSAGGFISFICRFDLILDSSPSGEMKDGV
jgi:hypothetical protein